MKTHYKLGSLIGTALGAVFVVWAVFSSKSSTAPVGLILIPVYALMGAALGVGLAYVAETIRGLRRGQVGFHKVTLSLAILTAIGICGWGWASRHQALASLKSSSLATEELRALYFKSYLFGRPEVVNAIAEHPNASPELLDEIAHREKDYVRALVSGNENASPQLITEIASAPPSYERHFGAARNPKTPIAVFEKLLNISEKDFPGLSEYRLYQTFVLGPLAKNPALPKELFAKLASWEKPEYFFAVGIVQSPHASCEQIARFTSDQNQVLASTAQSAAREKNCPQDR